MKRLVLASFALLPFVVAVTPSDPPSPVPAECPPLPTTLGRIAGMQTGQFIENGDGATLRFSSDVRACGEWSNDFHSGDCHDSWSFRLDFPREGLLEGEHYLSQLGTTFGDSIIQSSPPSQSEGGCSRSPPCGSSGMSAGAIGVSSPVAKLVIESANAACITGTVVGIGHPSADAPNFNGAFFAVRCAP